MRRPVEILEPLLLRLPMLYAVARRLFRLSDPDRAVFCGLVPLRATVVEVGANTGHYTTLLARLVGSHGRVFAFEPNPIARLALESRLGRDGVKKRVSVRSEAVGSSSGSAVLSWPVGETAQSARCTHSNGSWAGGPPVESEEVRMVSLDEFAEEEGLAAVGLLKLDIEGAELAALAGARRLIERFRPVLHIEVCPQWQHDFGYGAQELAEELSRAGFDRVFWVTSRGRLEPGTVANPPQESTNAVCFMSAVHRIPRSWSRRGAGA